MVSKKRQGVFLPELSEDASELGKEFMKSPKAFAEKYGLDPDNLECPPQVHEAMDRGQEFADRVHAEKFLPNDESMSALDEIARNTLGEEYLVSLIPFGLKFRERANVSSTEITGTGSGTVSFLDSDADVDG